MRAVELYESGQVEAALALLDEELNPESRERIVEGHLWALRILCRQDLEEGDLEDEYFEQARWVDELVGEGPTKEFKLAAGIFLSEHDAFGLAEHVLARLCNEDTNSHIPVFNLALVHERDGRSDEAINGYQKTIAMAPEWPHGHLYLARCLRDSGRPLEAVEPLSKYLELEPEDQDEWISLAILHSNSGNFESANSAYNRASFVDPTSISLNFNRGITASRAEDREQLEKTTRTLEKQCPDDWRTHLLRGYLRELDGDLWTAWEAFSEAASPEFLESEDEEARECAATHALAFTVTNGMKDQVEDMSSRCYASFSLSYDILFQLRKFAGLHAIEAQDFGVLVKSDLTDPDAIEQLMADDEIEPPFCYFRNYRVIADSPDTASKYAIAFEERVGGRNVEIEEITEVETVRDVFLGVWWLARELHCFSENAALEE